MNNKVKYIMIIISFIILSILGYLFLPKEEIVYKEEAPQNDYIYVHIDGCINEPGLVKIKYGTRLYELIEEAGGETKEADLSRINLSMIVNDEQKIVIPHKIEEENEESGIININTASKEKLMTLSGIGAGTADKIIKYRQENGYFNSVDELKNISGISENKLNKIRDDITI